MLLLKAVVIVALEKLQAFNKQHIAITLSLPAAWVLQLWAQCIQLTTKFYIVCVLGSSVLTPNAVYKAVHC